LYFGHFDLKIKIVVQDKKLVSASSQSTKKQQESKGGALNTWLIGRAAIRTNIKIQMSRDFSRSLLAYRLFRDQTRMIEEQLLVSFV
jgi:hypothetical protein